MFTWEYLTYRNLDAFSFNKNLKTPKLVLYIFMEIKQNLRKFNTMAN
jgi:hypothetical protein